MIPSESSSSGATDCAWCPALDGEADSQDRLTRSGVDADRATVTIHDDASCDIEAKTGALAYILGRIEGLKSARRHRGWHARSGVADLDDDDVAFRSRRYP